MVEGVGDAILAVRVTDVPVAELEVGSFVGDRVRDVERPDLVVLVGPVVAPHEDAVDSHVCEENAALARSANAPRLGRSKPGVPLALGEGESELLESVGRTGFEHAQDCRALRIGEVDVPLLGRGCEESGGELILSAVNELVSQLGDQNTPDLNAVDTDHPEDSRIRATLAALDPADLIGQQDSAKICKISGAVHQHTTHGLAIACGQREVVLQMVDRMSEVKSESVFAARLEEADKLGSGAGADLHTGEVHAFQRSTLAYVPQVQAF